MIHPSDSIVEIITRATQAPSGDNSQPWRFKFDGDVLSILNTPGGDETLYNFRERGSYLAHGALAENIALLAPACGLQAAIEPFPGSADVTARITFADGEQFENPFVQAIEGRTTNRKPYKKVPLQPEHKSALLQAAEDGGLELLCAEDRGAIRTLAQAISTNERLVMENRQLHDTLFGMIRWSRKDEEQRPGLFVKTLEFPGPMLLLVRLLGHWPFVHALNRIGFSRGVPKQSAQLYESSSAICALVIRGEQNEDFFTAGRIFQRIWLACTSMGVSVQPVTAIPYLEQRIRAGETASLTGEQVAYMQEAYDAIARTLSIGEDRYIAMLFRVGYGPAPTASSKKLAPKFVS